MLVERDKDYPKIILPNLNNFTCKEVYRFDLTSGNVMRLNNLNTIGGAIGIVEEATEDVYQLLKTGILSSCLFSVTGPTGSGKDTLMNLLNRVRMEIVSDWSRQLNLPIASWETIRDKLLHDKTINIDPLSPFPNSELIKIVPFYEDSLIRSIQNGGVILAQKPAGTYFYDPKNSIEDVEREFGHKTIYDLITGQGSFADLKSMVFDFKIQIGVLPSMEMVLWDLYRSLLQSYSDDEIHVVDNEIQPVFKRFSFNSVEEFRKAKEGGGIGGINRTMEAIRTIGVNLWKLGYLKEGDVSDHAWRIIRMRPDLVNSANIIEAASSRLKARSSEYVAFVSDEGRYHEAIWARLILSDVLREVLTIVYRHEFFVDEERRQQKVANRPVHTLIVSNEPPMDLYIDHAALMRNAFKKKEKAVLSKLDVAKN